MCTSPLRYLVILAGALAAVATHGQGCTSGNCFDGEGTYVYSDGSKYVGEFTNSKAEGFGVCYYADGRTYVGEFSNHATAGHGSWTYKDGTRITGYYDESGKFVDYTSASTGCLEGDCENGFGTKRWDEGVEYKGDFKNGECDGFGTCYFNDGSKYTGQWKHHQFDGNGTRYLADGSVERGLFREHQFIGKVTGQKETGCLQGDCENGVGMYRFEEGGIYSGEFKDGEINGQGTYFFPDGGKYVGGWLNARFEGQGTYTPATGEIQTGVWHNHELVNATTAEALRAVVNWEQPISVETDLTYTTYALKACIKSASPITNIRLRLNGNIADNLVNPKTDALSGCSILYQKTINLLPGKNLMTIEVENEGGFSESPDRMIHVVNTTEQRRLALVIGNANYVHGNALQNPINDARAIAAKLKAEGFEVIETEDVALREMKIAIDHFGRQLENYDVGLFYYAGHGIQVKGLNYLVPVDADIQSEAQVEYDCVLADRVLSYMEVAQTDVNIIILDACRNNPFKRSWSRSAEGGGLAFMNAPTGTLIAYSTGPNRTASDGEGKNGLYTEALLEEVGTPDITILQVFQRVRAKVAVRSGQAQIPWESTSLTGDFYFASGK